MTAPADLVVVGGGIMGSAAAIRAAQGGMRVVLLERHDLGGGASGVNAGTLSLQIKRVALMPYALAGHAIWEAMGDAVGFRRTGGFTLAFTDHEAELLTERMTLKREAGAPIELVSAAAVAAREPGIRAPVLASWCPEDGYANSSLTGAHYRALLREAGVEVRERTTVSAMAPSGGGFVLETTSGPVRARRLLLAAGSGLEALLEMLGVHIPIRVRINTVSVTERAPPLVGAVVGHVSGLLTLKQKANGTVLIGGGWQGRRDGDRGVIDAATLIPNLQLAQHAVPALGALRVVRSWTGFEANVSDLYPLAGAVPGVENAFVLGCVRGGYTIGPYIGGLMGDLILGREPERPLFDPARLNPRPVAAAASGALAS